MQYAAFFEGLSAQAKAILRKHATFHPMFANSELLAPGRRGRDGLFIAADDTRLSFQQEDYQVSSLQMKAGAMVGIYNFFLREAPRMTVTVEGDHSARFVRIDPAAFENLRSLGEEG